MIFDATVAGRTLRVEVRGGEGRYQARLDGRPIEVDLHQTGRDFVSLLIDGRSYELGLEKTASGYKVVFPEDNLQVELQEATRGGAVNARRAVSGPARVTAPMPGKVVRVLVAPGEQADAGHGLLVMEAMKMENEIRAPRAGRIREVLVREGQAVEQGALLIVLE